MIKYIFQNGLIDYTIIKTLWVLNDNEKNKKLYEYSIMTLFILIIMFITCKMQKNSNGKKNNYDKNFCILLVNIIQIFKSKELIKENQVFTNCIIFGCFFFYLNSKIKK